MPLDRLFDIVRRAPRRFGRGLVLAYRYSIAALIGPRCRHLPSCSEYADEALDRYGLWAGGWMTLARLCRCHPWGTSGLDFVCETLPADARWYRPWRYGRWRGVNDVPHTDFTSPIDQKKAAPN
jgi:putative membrane protein insertion efficiency factor